MKLLIEQWDENNLDGVSCELMKEAVICYKVGAYRSAYFMPYSTRLYNESCVYGIRYSKKSI